MCHVAPNFSLAQRAIFRGSSRYLGHSITVHRKFLEAFEKKSFTSKSEILSEYSDKTSLFEVKLFFQRPLENFLLSWRTFSRYLKSPPNLVLCVSKKKNRDHTTHQSDYMSGKVKKVEILKKWSSKSGWNILTNPHFLSWNSCFKGL